MNEPMLKLVEAKKVIIYLLVLKQFSHFAEDAQNPDSVCQSSSFSDLCITLTSILTIRASSFIYQFVRRRFSPSPTISFLFSFISKFQIFKFNLWFFVLFETKGFPITLMKLFSETPLDTMAKSSKVKSTIFFQMFQIPKLVILLLIIVFLLLQLE